MNEKTDDVVPSCANCFFSEEQQLNPIIMDPQENRPLVCRRLPPTIVQIATPMGQPAIGAAHPPVAPGDWCGEHEATRGPLIGH